MKPSLAVQQERFDEIRFDNTAVVVEKTRYGKNGMRTELFLNEVLVACKKVNNKGSSFFFYGEKK
ncbi:hypothetical protein [Pantoea sp. MBLJ3]|uniref:hypothetical protein n=1 Tax=Pantoea sp. MBLJ3 TaxID=1562889 RepID=UPI00057D5AFD|nr:hypothetical protein [Pantoea sp. MBLJ3]